MYQIFSLKVTSRMGIFLFVLMNCVVQQSLEVSEV